MFSKNMHFWKKTTPCWKILKISFRKKINTSQIHVLCANFVKFGRPEIGKVVHYLTDKKQISARCLALASARIAPKICQASGKQCTCTQSAPNFIQNWFTSGGVIAKRVNIAEMRHKVFPILGEASSPSNKVHKTLTSL